MYFSHMRIFNPLVAFVSEKLHVPVASYVSDTQWRSSYVIHPLVQRDHYATPLATDTEIFHVYFAA